MHSKMRTGPLVLASYFTLSGLTGCATASKTTPESSSAAPAQAVVDESKSCQDASLALSPDTAVARVNGTTIFAKDVTGLSGGENEALRTYCSTIAELRKNALRGKISEVLIERAAAEAEVSPEEWLKAQVQPREITDAEVLAAYERYAGPAAPDLNDELRAGIRGQLRSEAVNARLTEVLGELHSASTVDIDLPDVRPAAQDVALAPHTATYGDVQSQVTVVEFADFECPACASAAMSMEAAKAKYGDRVLFAFRHFPLSFHKKAMPAAIYAQCAGRQGKFWEFHDALFSAPRQLEDADLRERAVKLGFDVEKMKSCVIDPAIRSEVEADMALAKEIGVSGTPSFYINGRLHEGSFDIDSLSAAIEQEIDATRGGAL